MPSETLHATSHATTHPRTEVRSIRQRLGEPATSRRRQSRSVAPRAHLSDMSNHTIATPITTWAELRSSDREVLNRTEVAALLTLDPRTVDHPIEDGTIRRPHRPPSPDSPASVPSRVRRRRRGSGMTTRRKTSAGGDLCRGEIRELGQHDLPGSARRKPYRLEPDELQARWTARGRDSQAGEAVLDLGRRAVHPVLRMGSRRGGALGTGLGAVLPHRSAFG